MQITHQTLLINKHRHTFQLYNLWSLFPPELVNTSTCMQHRLFIWTAVIPYITSPSNTPCYTCPYLVWQSPRLIWNLVQFVVKVHTFTEDLQQVYTQARTAPQHCVVEQGTVIGTGTYTLITQIVTFLTQCHDQ